MENQKDKYLHIRVSTEEKLRIAVEAERLGISISAFILMLINQYIHGITCTKSSTKDNDPIIARKC